MLVTSSITKRQIQRTLRSGEAVKLERYVLHYRDAAGKRTQNFYKTKREAQLKQADLAKKIEELASIKKSVPTVAEAFDYWIKDRTGQVKKLTLEGYKKLRPYVVGPLIDATRQEKFLISYYKKNGPYDTIDMLGDHRLDKLTSANISAWHKTLTEKIGSDTANRAKQCLGTILSIAAEDFEVRPPIIPRRLGRNRKKEKKLLLSVEQVKQLLAAAQKDTETGIYYAFPFLTGTRIGEQLGLLWSEVDFEKRVITICRVQERDGTVCENTKTEAGRRDIPMSSLLYDMLKAWRKICPREEGQPDRVFPGIGKRDKHTGQRLGGGTCLLYSNFRTRIWVRTLKKNNLPLVSPHSARHFFVSTLQAQGVEVGLVSKLAGHANAVVTLGHYTQAMRGGEDAVEKLTQLF